MLLVVVVVVDRLLYEASINEKSCCLQVTPVFRWRVLSHAFKFSVKHMRLGTR